MNMEINQDTFRAAMRQPVEHPDDCQYIVYVAKDAFGIDMTPCEAALIWQDYSERSAAGWLTCDDYDEIAYAIRAFVEGRTGG